MKRHPRSTSFDFTHPGIPGDELEQDRIQLEHNLQNTDLSFRLSSQGDNDSIEYPRHNSGHLNDFGSFINHSRGNFGDGDTHHGWSYRTGDDEEGINPYGGETMSTAAHHASALTLTAGLGGRGNRRDASLSGAEYDPDRPLENIIGGVDSRFSLFDLDPSRSKYSAPGPGISLDPLVVDSTAELDRILESGYALPPAPRDADTHFSRSSSSSSSSDSEGGPSSRPKIVDSLRRVSFSPKRPRVVHPTHTPRHRSSNLPGSTQSIINSARHVTSPLVREASLSLANEQNVLTPKARQSTKRTNNQSTPRPEVRLQPPTPSSSTSRFAQKARVLTRELDAEVQHTYAAQSKNRSVGDSLYTNAEIPSISYDIPPANGTPAPKRTQKIYNTPSLSKSHNNSHSKLHLPDVTGLTNAVESPAKGALSSHYPYQSSNEPREIEVRLLTVMNTIQDKLEQLEDENGISRRRVRELELELEMCKKDVARERTRVIQKEEAILQNQRELERAVADAKRSMKGKTRARDTSMHADIDASVRYKEAVEEKKALESLITTLRSHLTRLTAELSSHQELLVELRSFRESDARALKEKTSDITRLRVEVERLAGEVEVLRGVVEEGLKERRLARENSRASVSQVNSESMAQQEILEDTEEAVDSTGVREDEHQQELEEEEDREEEGEEELEEEDLDDHEEPEPFDPMSIPGSSRELDALDKTVRTDRATVGTPGASQRNISRPTRFIDDDELERIAADVEERRSERSAAGTSRSQFDSRVLNPSRSASPVPAPTAVTQRRATVEDVADMNDSVRNLHLEEGNRSPSPALSSASVRLRRVKVREAQEIHQPNRPSPPTPGHATTHNHRPSYRHADPDDSIAETPFPQIRGERLEKLFFSAPEHNQKTCNVCCRHRGPRGVDTRPMSPSWLPSRFAQDVNQHNHEADGDVDEGFAEGSEEANQENFRDQFARGMKRNGKQRDMGPPRDTYEQRKNLPQQTVLARVIRELEDDFTHYKSVYVELADQYKDMDPVSDVPRRNLLAQHLREVVDILEQKGDQIASLYDLLTFKDKLAVDAHSRPQPRATEAANALRAAGLRRHPTFA
ncbi:hypothetical protein C8J55DRAFT_469841 [Lentinula edodes]|uniref:Cep57 centrosome microtubule-binding domain-containing protein n=1 Tax=Lentinula lateritia TaxID=40482 RepID=A0A9W9AVV6_9AGAR|nr:hypothetical protein C8J55DRAFT_469841 [Lentinula edodes]